MNDERYQRPRERLQTNGPAQLSFIELWQIVIGSGSVKASSAQLARKVSRLVERSSSQLNVSELTAISGIGPAKACQLMAVLEISRRLAGKPVTR